MFARFTERARQVVLAQEKARLLGHNYIGNEHVLLGLLGEQKGVDVAARVLESLGITVESVRDYVVRIAGSGQEVAPSQIPFTPRAKEVLEFSLREALALGHNYIGPEHVLLGLVHEREGLAARVLLDHDADAERVRSEVVRILSGSEHAGGQAESVPTAAPGAARAAPVAPTPTSFAQLLPGARARGGRGRRSPARRRRPSHRPARAARSADFRGAAEAGVDVGTLREAIEGARRRSE